MSTNKKEFIAQIKIYIPIWFYFNSITEQFDTSNAQFTFQYGSTLITPAKYTFKWSESFTFQYGSTLI